MTTYQPLKAAAYMIAAGIAFTSMAVAGKTLAAELDTFEIMTYRSLIGIVVVLAIALGRGKMAEINCRNLGLHAIRNASHFAGQNLWFYAVTLITLPQLFAFEFSVPLWVAILAPVFLAERLTRTRLITAIVGFGGILIVARPDMIGFTPGIIAAAASAIGFTGSAIATKLLTRTQTTICIMFWLTVMQAVFGIICAGYDMDIALPSPAALPWVVLVGLAGLFAHFCITSALQIAPAVVVFPVDFIRLPLAVTVSVFYYDEPFEMAVILGAVIIFSAVYVNIRAESRSIARR
ncbi:MAG: DMT family transporter [Rhodobacteraceae bacterium]|nr:DMT family transporter [Paracoccaceae bacterium]